MEKIRLDLEALEAEAFVTDARCSDEAGTVAAHEAGPTRQCWSPGCTSDCV
ncbi:MAG TPA: hypothetical protein VF771_00640 [Longimicrobiaceae bacterium]